ncbi:histidine triad nucleotide-binding protein [Pelomicrobium sp.]|jgi:histidine triad (HIT) family protein|uniref:histidine triad nucleotide-binding protein n=1 Tax=Pelomicrobium sp. TaxID=2815319 RepID=UPI002FDD9B20
MDSCVFCRIVRGELPSRKVYEDEEILAFHDINPLAAVHFMIIPKQHVESLAHVTEAHRGVLGKILVMAPRLAQAQGLNEGFRVIINTGRISRQEIFHLHVHVIGDKEVLPPMLVRPHAP